MASDDPAGMSAGDVMQLSDVPRDVEVTLIVDGNVPEAMDTTNPGPMDTAEPVEETVPVADTVNETETVDDDIAPAMDIKGLSLRELIEENESLGKARTALNKENVDLNKKIISLREKNIEQKEKIAELKKENTSTKERNLKLKKKNAKNQKKMRNLRRSIRQMRKVALLRKSRPIKPAVLKKQLLERHSKATVNHLFRHEQKDQKPKRARYTDEEIINALMMRKFSLKAYKFARDNRMMNLPSPSALRKRIKHFRVAPGINHSSLHILKKHMEVEEDEENGVVQAPTDLKKMAVLMFDEMSVSRDITYDAREDRFYPSSSKMQVALCRGLAHKYKLPVFVDFDRKMDKDLLEEIIEKCEEAGVHIIAIVSDLATDNQGLHKSLGVTMNKPHFQHPKDPSRTIFVMADVPHLVKLNRNHLL